MRRPCLSCLPALLMLLAISGVVPCIQTLDGHGYPATEYSLLAADGLLSVSAIMTPERGIRLLAASLCLLPAVIVWPHATCCCSLLQPYQNGAMPRRTGVRGLVPLPDPPPCSF